MCSPVQFPGVAAKTVLFVLGCQHAKGTVQSVLQDGTGYACVCAPSSRQAPVNFLTPLSLGVGCYILCLTLLFFFLFA